MHVRILFNLIMLLLLCIFGQTARRRRKKTIIPIQDLPKNSTIIDLKNYELNSTTAEDFDGFYQLQELSFRGNSLTTFPNLTHVGMTLLKLDIRSNDLTTVDKNLLSFLDVLQELYLSHNPLVSAPNLDDLGDTLIHLKLRNIHVSDWTADSLKEFKVLEVFIRSNSNLTSFPNMVHVRYTIKRLDLSGNLIDYIPPGLIDMLVMLEKLVLDENRLQSIPDVSGPGKTLHTLGLSKNYFTIFPSLTKIGSNLQTLNIANNFINKIPPRNFNFINRVNASSPLNISLDFNQVATIPPIVGIKLSLVHIFTNGLPLKCDSKLSWIIVSDNFSIPSGICKEPRNLNGVSLNNVTLSQLNLEEGHKESIVTSTIGKMGDNVYSTVMPVVKANITSSVECAVKCSQTPGCLYFNYCEGSYGKNNFNDITKCHFSSPLMGKKQNDSEYENKDWAYYYLL